MDEAAVTHRGGDMLIGADGDNFLLRVRGEPAEVVEVGDGVRVDGMHPVYFVSAPWTPAVWRVDAETCIWDALDDTVIEVAEVLREHVD